MVGHSRLNFRRRLTLYATSISHLRVFVLYIPSKRFSKKRQKGETQVQLHFGIHDLLVYTLLTVPCATPPFKRGKKTRLQWTDVIMTLMTTRSYVRARPALKVFGDHFLPPLAGAVQGKATSTRCPAGSVFMTSSIVPPFSLP